MIKGILQKCDACGDAITLLPINDVHFINIHPQSFLAHILVCALRHVLDRMPISIRGVLVSKSAAIVTRPQT